MQLDDEKFMQCAYKLARKGYEEGGCPIGAVLVDNATGAILGAGHNMLVQEGNPVLHGEMTALRAAGRMESRENCTMYTTLSPCMMCAGTIVQFKIPKVVIGENRTFGGNEAFLRSHGVEVVVLDDLRCVELMSRFQTEHPDIWAEDIGED